MAIAGETIEAPARGTRIVFLKTEAQTGEFLEYDEFIKPANGFFASHYHMNQEVRTTILSGVGVYSLADGKEKTAGPGETVVIPPGMKHVDVWNKSQADLHYRNKIIPPLGIEIFLETWFGLVRDQQRRSLTRTNAMGLLQAATTGYYIASETLAGNLPIPLQRLGLPLVALIGKWLGYKPYFPKYTELYLPYSPDGYHPSGETLKIK